MEKAPPESFAAADAAGHLRYRTMEFVAWSQDSGHLLFELRARNGDLFDKEGRAAFYRWFCYFNTRTGEFEVDRNLSWTNGELRPNWATGDGSISENHLPLRAGDIGTNSMFAVLKGGDVGEESALNSTYNALLKRTPADGVAAIRQEQRHWLKSREALAWVHVAQRWTRFEDSIVDEGLYLATRLRTNALTAAALKAQPGPNIELAKSPDGKFGILSTFSAEDLDHDRVKGMELVALPSRRVLIDLYDEVENRGLRAFWAPDSRHFVFHSGSRRIASFTIYARQGDDFVALKTPDFDRFRPKTGKGERSGHFNGVDANPVRWLGPKRLLVHYNESFDVESEKGDRVAESNYDIVVAIDGAGKVVIEKATRRGE